MPTTRNANRPKAVKTGRIALRLDEHDYKELHEAASLDGVSISAYVRSLLKADIADRKGREIPKKESQWSDQDREKINRLIDQLKRIGNNLNQIVRLAHQRSCAAPHSDEDRQQLIEVLEYVRDYSYGAEQALVRGRK